MPIIEAAVLAMVILIIDLIGFAHRLEEKPLIIPAIYKTLLFSLLEEAVRGLIHHKGIWGGIQNLTNAGRYELLSRNLTKFFALIPLFAFREVGRALGEGRPMGLFFLRSRPWAEGV